MAQIKETKQEPKSAHTPVAKETAPSAPVTVAKERGTETPKNRNKLKPAKVTDEVFGVTRERR